MAKRHAIKLVAALTGLALISAACQQATSGPSAEPQGSAVTTTVQSAQLQPAPAGAKPSGWETAEATRGQLSLLAQFDSSGPDAWDVKKSPNVFISSMGKAPKPTGAKIDGAGLYVMDIYTKQVVASRAYDLGEDVTQSSHTVAASPDGKWLYLMLGDQVAATKQTRNMILIVSARTLKVDRCCCTRHSACTTSERSRTTRATTA